MRQYGILLAILHIFAACFAAGAAAFGPPVPETNLYRVYVGNQAEARALSAFGCDAVVKTPNGYLVLAPVDDEARFAGQGLAYKLVAPGVDRSRIMMDMRRDRTNVDAYPMIYDEGGVRLFLAETADMRAGMRKSDLVPLPPIGIPIEYRPPQPLTKALTADMADLDALVGLIRQDSLESYSYQLQAFDGRQAGSYGALHSALWLESKFEEFGYDSIVIFNHKDSVYDEYATCREVVAYKPGTTAPDYHVIIGAHYDTEPGSPGADDNGSGVAGVLEMARVLAGVETDLTFVFALFDAEEEGLLGAWYLANRAYTRGDRIAFMLNMDMIAHYQNSSHGKVYCQNSDYAQLWIDLADSLEAVNITGHVFGGGSSDQIPFEQLGYEAMLVSEYIFSTVYHSQHDSTTYMNFDYMTRMVMASLATAYVIGQNYEPAPDLIISGPDRYIRLLTPEVAAPVEVLVNAYGGAAVIPGGVRLEYSINSGVWITEPMADAGTGVYTGMLPALSCTDRIEYRVTVETESLGTYYYPAAAMSILACAATDTATAFADDFSTDKGWTVSTDATTGAWERGRPYKNSWGGAPVADYDGSSLCYATGIDFGKDVDNGATILTSPRIDATGEMILVQYARWYSNGTGGAPYTDEMEVSVSNNDGASWTLAETVGPVDQASGGWYVHGFWLNDFVEPTKEVRLRFVASDTGEDSQVEAAVDAAKIMRFSFGPRITTIALPNWTVGVPYEQTLEALACSETLTWVDKYGHLAATGLTVAPSGLVSGTPVNTGTILFVAGVTDDGGRNDQAMFSLYINPAPVIVTDAVPTAVAGQAYAFQMYATGGTGTKSWSDVNNDLAAAGLSLAADGLLAGTPSTPGEVAFTARVEDDAGAFDDRAFVLIIWPVYVCGDANGDGIVNVGDPVYIINYVFKDGPPPDPLVAGNSNCDDDINVGDAVYLINFVFKNGPKPCCP